MSKTRTTVEVIASGQPRAYADSRLHVRVEFEWNGWDPKNPLVPNYMSEEAARRRLESLQCGFVGKTRSEVSWPDTYLDWLKPIDPKKASEVIDHGDPNQTVAAVWEFHTTSPFTD